MNPLDQFDQLGPALGAVMATITPDQLSRTTPCHQLSVGGIVEHMLAGATGFAAAFRGVEASEAAVPPTEDELLALIGPALGELGAAMHSPGALERTIVAPFGVVPGDTFARFVVLDGLVHGWDLSVATGQPYDPPADVIAAVRDFAQEALAGLRDGDTFAAAVEPPAGATPIERLAAFTGRTVPVA